MDEELLLLAVSHASVSAQNAKVPSQQVCPTLFHRCVDYDSMAPRYLALDTVSTCIMRARAEQLVQTITHLARLLMRVNGDHVQITLVLINAIYCYLAIAHRPAPSALQICISHHCLPTAKGRAHGMLKHDTN